MLTFVVPVVSNCIHIIVLQHRDSKDPFTWQYQGMNTNDLAMSAPCSAYFDNIYYFTILEVCMNAVNKSLDLF